MNTFGIDMVTMFIALKKLENDFLGSDRVWMTDSQQQVEVFKLYHQFKGQLDDLKHLKAMASTDWKELNHYLTENGCEEMFDGPLNGIGVVSILDMLVQWLEKAEFCEIHGVDWQKYSGFEIAENSRDIYKLDGTKNPIVKLKTKSGDSLWLTIPETPPNDTADLIRFAFSTMAASHKPANNISTIKVPEINFDIKPNIKFMCGANTHDTNGQNWYINKASQQFKLSIDEEGAQVIIATGIGMMMSASYNVAKPLVFNKPFTGWLTQKGSKIPIGIFYADYDSWKNISEK